MPGPRLILSALAAVLICTAGAGWQGYRMGYAVAQAAQDARLLAEIQAGMKAEEARRALAQERDRLATQLKEEADADPVVVERCLGPGRLQRLNALR